MTRSIETAMLGGMQWKSIFYQSIKALQVLEL